MISGVNRLLNERLSALRLNRKARALDFSPQVHHLKETNLFMLRERSAMMNDENKGGRTFTEEFEIAGHQLLARIKELIAEGNVRTLRVKTESGDSFLEIPLTAGAIAGGVVVLAAPWLAAIGAIAALATRVRVEIVRNAEDADDRPSDRNPSDDL